MVRIFIASILLSLAIPTIGYAKTEQKQGGKVLYAIMETTKGTIKIKLFEKEAPKTVANFTELAEGKREWTDPYTGKKGKSHYFDGLIFHRVIPKFMIQGGDPTGTGRGGPGYRFDDEFHKDLNHAKPGMLSMANAGPGTNGSQFFLTVAPTPFLDGKHSVFGEIVEGLDVAIAISNVPRDSNDRPREDVKMIKVTIVRE